LVQESGNAPPAVSESPHQVQEKAVAPEPAAAPPAAAPPAEPAASPGALDPGALDIVAMRRIWPDLLDVVNQKNKTATALLRNAEPTGVTAKALTVTFSTSQLANMFGEKSVFLRDALRSVVGADLQIEVAVAGKSASTASSGGAAAPADPAPEEIDVSDSADVEAEPPAPEDPVALLQSGLGAQVIGEIDPA
jgi:DNA polymerase-3 subunit gamma/tau